MTSPAGSLLLAIQREMSQGTEYGQFWDNEQRTTVPRGVFDAYYHRIHPRQLVFDTNRLWTTKLPLLKLLFPSAKTICCVRNVAWVLDSIESLLRRNCLETSKIFNFEPGGTVYTRMEGLAANNGMVGFSLHAVREAIFGDQAGDVLLGGTSRSPATRSARSKKFTGSSTNRPLRTTATISSPAWKRRSLTGGWVRPGCTASAPRWFTCNATASCRRTSSSATKLIPFGRIPARCRRAFR